jgi:transcription elongation factor GreA
MGERVPVSAEGYEALKRQVAELERKQFEASQAVGAAAEKGDLTENAEFEAAKENLGLVQAKLSETKERLQRAVVIDPSKAPADMVAFGAKVTVIEIGPDGSEDEEEVFQLVGPGEADVMSNKILSTSPIGQALLRRKVGDEVEADVPAGKLRFRVVGIEY